MTPPPREKVHPAFTCLLVLLTVVVVLFVVGTLLIGAVCDGDGFSCTG